MPSPIHRHAPRRESLDQACHAPCGTFPRPRPRPSTGLQQTDDRKIWEWAQANGHTILTADSDFVELAERLGWPPKVIHLQRCDYPARVIENLLRQHAIRIAEFERNRTTGILVIAAS
jgi:predicted nuclease of predicted toxin-antitoxin system